MEQQANTQFIVVGQLMPTSTPQDKKNLLFFLGSTVSLALTNSEETLTQGIIRWPLTNVAYNRIASSNKTESLNKAKEQTPYNSRVGNQIGA